MATLATIRSQVRNLILERTGDTGLVTDVEANEIINIAARILFIRIAARWGEALAQRSASNVVVPSTGILPFNTISSGAQIIKVLDIRAGTTAASELAMRTVKPFNKSHERSLYDGASATIPFRYHVEGANVIFSPLPAATFDCRVAWVQMPADMSADGTNAWDSRLPEHHDAITVLASIMILNKDQVAPAPFAAAFEYVERVFADRFGPPGPYSILESKGRP